MKKHVLLCMCIPALLLLASCASQRVGDSPYETLTLDAIHHFGDLREAGKLPGIARDEHGRVETEAIPQTEHVSYPVSVVLHVTAEQDRSRLSYVFTKENSTSEWRLIKAWRTKLDGQHEDLKIE
jgi:hypothetical protein